MTKKSKLLTPPVVNKEFYYGKINNLVNIFSPSGKKTSIASMEQFDKPIFFLLFAFLFFPFYGETRLASGPSGWLPWKKSSRTFSEVGTWIFVITLVKGINLLKPHQSADKNYKEQEI